MPTYGYRCDNCGNEFDLRQSFHDEPRANCPKCQSAAQRQFHAPPVIYKGSGFYTTDYARKGGSGSSSSNGVSPNSPSSGESSFSSESSSSSDSSSSPSATSSKSDAPSSSGESSSSKPSSAKTSD